MKIKSLSLLLVSLFSVYRVSAQETVSYFGFQGGLMGNMQLSSTSFGVLHNSGFMLHHETDKISATSGEGAYAGLVAMAGTDWIMVRIEANGLYTQKSIQYTANINEAFYNPAGQYVSQNVNGNYKLNTNAGYLQIPAMVQYNAGYNVRYYINAGAFFDICAYHANTGTYAEDITNEYGGGLTHSSGNINTRNDLGMIRTYEGVMGSIGLFVPREGHAVDVYARFYYGLSPATLEPDVLDRSITLGFSYLLDFSYKGQ